MRKNTLYFASAAVVGLGATVIGLKMGGLGTDAILGIGGAMAGMFCAGRGILHRRKPSCFAPA